jgi:hypothetical protein
MMHGAMQKAGIEQRLDARSWADQGRGDLTSLREEKTLQGFGPEAMDRHLEIDQLRKERAELPPPHLDRAAAIEHVERQAERQIAGVQGRESQELSHLDNLIAAARELAVEVKERTVAAAQNIVERVEQFRGRFERWREQKIEGKPEQQLKTQKGFPAETKQEKQRAGPELVANDQFTQGRQAFRERYEAYKQAKEAAVIPESKQEQALEKNPEKAQEQEQKIERGRGFGLSL